MSEIEIEIDGKVLKAQPNQMVIQVADAAGIYIPRFCYHKHLSVAANCRMCLVEVEKSPKTLPACATPVMPGMKVFTRSPKALAAQKAVMEFLLINHPLDCPICDQGGECELQDLSLGFGAADSKFNEGKRSVKDKDIGPLIETEMTRCIQCTRCVRFGDEVAGLRELGATGRGENMEIGTYVEHAIQSEVSGNIIDLCPVGALTSKPFRFTARAWELQQYPSIAPHDCIGSNINVHTRRGTVMRVVPRENNKLNQTWLSDRDRFSYEGLCHSERVTVPQIRIGNSWQETDWQTALEFAVTGLQKVISAQDADGSMSSSRGREALGRGDPEHTQLGVLASPNSTIEEFYLLQKLLRGLGGTHIDHRLRQTDFSDQAAMPLFPGLNASLDEVENADVIVLIGSNIQKEQPMASLRVRKAALKGAKVISVNMLDYQFHFNVAEKLIAAPHQFLEAIAKLADSTYLAEGKKIHFILGAMALNHPHAAHIRKVSFDIAQRFNATMSFLTEGCNSAGAWIAGAIPHRAAAGKAVEKIGLDAKVMMTNPRRAYLLLNVEPELDCAHSVLTTQALAGAEFVVALSQFHNESLRQSANVILPVAAFTETSGTYVNALGEWQSFNGVAAAFAEARPAWKVLRVMGNLFHVDGFDYESSEEVKDELTSLLSGAAPFAAMDFSHNQEILRRSTPQDDKLSRIGEVPIYATDSLVRHAKSLQATQTIVEGQLAAVRIHPETAMKLNVKDGATVVVKQQDNRVQLPVIFDSRVPVDAALIAGGLVETYRLDGLFGEVEIIKLTSTHDDF